MNNRLGGGIIAVSYEARAFGVTRSMRGDDAKEVCPDIHLCRVEESRGKLDKDGKGEKKEGGEKEKLGERNHLGLGCS